MQQKELAAELGIDPSNLSDYEKDKTAPSIAILKEIGKICRMHPVYFFDNSLPTKYERLLEDLEYASYLAYLDDEVRESFRFALKAVYSKKLVDDANPLKDLVTKAADEANRIKDLEGYFALLEKLELVD